MAQIQTANYTMEAFIEDVRNVFVPRKIPMFKPRQFLRS